jgi:hypothetical protein
MYGDIVKVVVVPSDNTLFIASALLIFQENNSKFLYELTRLSKIEIEITENPHTGKISFFKFFEENPSKPGQNILVEMETGKIIKSANPFFKLNDIVIVRALPVTMGELSNYDTTIDSLGALETNENNL